MEAIVALAIFIQHMNFELVPDQNISMTTGATIHTTNVRLFILVFEMGFYKRLLFVLCFANLNVVISSFILSGYKHLSGS